MIMKNYLGILLLFEISCMLFLLGFLPESWHTTALPVIYASLYMTTTAGLEQHKKMMFIGGVVIITIEFISRINELTVFSGATKILNFIFFSFIVISFIQQIAKAKTVSGRVILEAINGYLLLGIVFTFLISLMAQIDTTAFNFSQQFKPFDIIYYGFVTFATLGYGDLVPLKPYAKSLSILMAVCGQLYIAVIIALLVGKFSSQSLSQKD